MGGLRDNINACVAEALTEHQKKCGRRFSTYYESYARSRASFDGALESLKIVAEGVDVIWALVKQGEINKDYEDALNVMTEFGTVAIEHILEFLACIEKVRGGVVHESK